MSSNKKTRPSYSNPDTHPCIKEAELSMKCLEKNHYVNEKCKLFFDNYNSCREFWWEIMRKRRKNGIRPHMPTEKERTVIMDEKRKGNHIFHAKVIDP